MKVTLIATVLNAEDHVGAVPRIDRRADTRARRGRDRRRWLGRRHARIVCGPPTVSRRSSEPGANIARGRNLAIAHASHEVDRRYGRGLHLRSRLARGADRAARSGRRRRDGRDRADRRIAARGVRLVDHARSSTRPSSIPRRSCRAPDSVAFRREALDAVGGYPEWLADRRGHVGEPPVARARARYAARARRRRRLAPAADARRASGRSTSGTRAATARRGCTRSATRCAFAVYGGLLLALVVAANVAEAPRRRRRTRVRATSRSRAPARARRSGARRDGGHARAPRVHRHREAQRLRAGCGRQAHGRVGRLSRSRRTPRPIFRPRLPSATSFRRSARRLVARRRRKPRGAPRRCGQTVSSPIRSASASGPIGWREPQLDRGVDVLARGEAALVQSAIASYRYGISSRFTMNPASSLERTQVLPSTSTAERPRRGRTSLRSSRAAGVSSISGITGTGLKKCIPTTAPGTARRLGERTDRDRGRVRREHDLGPRELAERGEDRRLRLRILGGGLDHQVDRVRAPRGRARRRSARAPRRAHRPRACRAQPPSRATARSVRGPPRRAPRIPRRTSPARPRARHTSTIPEPISPQPTTPT